MFNFLLTHSPLLYFTQSLWRDEAYSILVAQHPISWIIRSVSFEPPVYYILLHMWIKLFGTNEIAVRSLSLVGFALATIVVISWSEKLFKNPWLRCFVPLFFFLNPMLLYYAFEVRTYGWYIFFATLSLFAYWQRRWALYIAATILGFYTHTYMIFVPIAQAVHWIGTHYFLRIGWKKLYKTLWSDPFVRVSLINTLFILPWIAKIMRDIGKLKSSWYFPVDFHLVASVLGNMFLGYEGTPWYFWGYTAALSVILIVLFLIALKKKESRKTTLLFLSMIFVPLTMVIGVSFVKPLFVNRYLIPVTIAEVFLIALAINTLTHQWVKRSLMGLGILFVVGFNIWYPPKHAKLDIRKTIMEINTIRTPNDRIFAESPLILFESTYYSSDPSRVYLYNPQGSPFPWYVGDTVFDTSRVARDIPTYPQRAFLVHENGTYELVYKISSTSIANTPRLKRNTPTP